MWSEITLEHLKRQGSPAKKARFRAFSFYAFFIRSPCLVVNIAENQVWVNEDTGAGMALYCFPFLAVMEVAASGAADPWETLLAKYPSAKMSG